MQVYLRKICYHLQGSRGQGVEEGRRSNIYEWILVINLSSWYVSYVNFLLWHGSNELL